MGVEPTCAVLRRTAVLKTVTATGPHPLPRQEIRAKLEKVAGQPKGFYYAGAEKTNFKKGRVKIFPEKSSPGPF